ncbi:MAG: DUF4832 domain-containing protein [Alistipes sp.]
MRFLKTCTSLLLIAPLLAISCSSSSETTPAPDTPSDDPSLTKVTYTALTTAIPNPERGFYYPYDYHFEGGVIPNALNKQAITVNRGQNRTLFLTEYFLRDFIDKPLSEACLTLIKTNMQALRDGGGKCVLRFAYCDSDAQSAKPWDAEEAIVMQHIAQLKPIFEEYVDVIYVLQAGFVGVWGEWYYTDHFGFDPKSVEDYKPRRHVVEALLNALPTSRMVAIRTPQAKLMCFELTGADSITQQTAYQGSQLSRLAGHNDCFLASGNDVGTFNNKVERALWMADSRYASMGGETCGVSSFCSCSNSLIDMAKYHWSYLNIGYHQEVIKGWKDNNCFDEIECRLGYRLVLTKASFTKDVKAGEPFKAIIDLTNTGFAAPVNPRGAELIFVADKDASEHYTIPLKDDPRYWFASVQHTIATTFSAPALKAGQRYTLYLNLPDPEKKLHDNPLFSIALANNDTWDATRGYNKLYTFTAQ